MDVSVLRKRILQAIDDARRGAAERRSTTDEAAKAFARFLDEIAVPLLQQTAMVLNVGESTFAVQTPAGSVRLASQRATETYLEIELDTARPEPEVIGRVSVAQGGRRGRILEERPLAAGKPVSSLTEEDVSAFLVAEVPKLVIKS